MIVAQHGNFTLVCTHSKTKLSTETKLVEGAEGVVVKKEGGAAGAGEAEKKEAKE
jgi:hypothetical protein